MSSHSDFHPARASRAALRRELTRRQARIDHLLDANAAAAEEMLRLRAELTGLRSMLIARGIPVPTRRRSAGVPS